MSDKMQEIRNKFVGFAGSIGADLGLSRVATQLYALLYLSPEPLSLDEMAQLIRVSKGNISVNIRVLQEWRAVRKVPRMGSRKDYYEADRDVIKVVINRLRSGLRRRIDEVNDEIGRFEELLGGSTNGLTEEDLKLLQAYRRRLKEIKKISGRADRLLKLSGLPFLK